MRYYSLLFFATLALASCHSSRAISVNNFEKKLISTQDAILLDVRTPKEFAEGHLPNAVNIDYKGGALKASLDTLDKEISYFLYCKSGGRSASSVRMMDSVGFKHVVDLKGGITAWKEAGKPLVGIDSKE